MAIKVKTDYMNDQEDTCVLDKDGYPQCPYCGNINECQHLLLSVDITFRNLEGGALFDCVENLLSKQSESQVDNLDYSADTHFDTLILKVEQVCDYEFYWDGFDTMPGMSSSYKIFWCKDEKKIKEIIEDFNKTKFEL
jgi:hypothetical protein